jgi:hypothetical protein
LVADLGARLSPTQIQEFEALVKKMGRQSGFIEPGLLKGFAKGGLIVLGLYIQIKEFKQNVKADIAEGMEEARTARFIGEEGLGSAFAIKGTAIEAAGGPLGAAIGGIIGYLVGRWTAGKAIDIGHNIIEGNINPEIENTMRGRRLEWR